MFSKVLKSAENFAVLLDEFFDKLIFSLLPLFRKFTAECVKKWLQKMPFLNMF
jgi:hypothetical protein